MGLDAAVYADDDCESEIASIRIGNVDGVVRLRESIKERFPDAGVLLTKVLYSASHCGDSLTTEEVARAKIELDQLVERCAGDEIVKDFVTDFGSIVSIAIRHRRPVTFT